VGPRNHVLDEVLRSPRTIGIFLGVVRPTKSINLLGVFAAMYAKTAEAIVLPFAG